MSALWRGAGPVFGFDGIEYGLKWDNSLQTNEAKSSSAYYQCCHCPEHFYYRDLEKMEFGGRWIAEDCTWTRDGIHFLIMTVASFARRNTLRS